MSLPYRANFCRARMTNFFKIDANFARPIVSPDKNFAWQSFVQQDNQNLSKWFVSLEGTIVLHLKTLLLLTGEILRRAKVMNFSFCNENFEKVVIWNSVSTNFDLDSENRHFIGRLFFTLSGKTLSGEIFVGRNYSPKFVL